MPHGQGYKLSDIQLLMPFMEIVRQYQLLVLAHCSEPIGHIYPGKGDVTLQDIVAFLTAFPVIDFFFPLLHEHEMAENVEEAVTLQHLFPEITGPITRRMLRVAFAALHFTGMTAAIEWKEMCLSVFQSRRHVNLVRIGRKMNKGA